MDDLEFAFGLIEEAIKKNHHFTSAQKDIAIKVTLDALAPTERPWFFEVANMLRIPLWQTLWGQWRRNQENGMAQAPVLDPGWEGEISYEYGLEEKTCPICETVFKPNVQGQVYCSNKCGAEVERRARIDRAQVSYERTVANEEIRELLKPPAHHSDTQDSLDLGEDSVDLGLEEMKPRAKME